MAPFYEAALAINRVPRQATHSSTECYTKSSPHVPTCIVDNHRFLGSTNITTCRRVFLSGSVNSRCPCLQSPSAPPRGWLHHQQLMLPRGPVVLAWNPVNNSWGTLKPRQAALCQLGAWIPMSVDYNKSLFLRLITPWVLTITTVNWLTITKTHVELIVIPPITTVLTAVHRPAGCTHPKSSTCHSRVVKLAVTYRSKHLQLA